MTSWADFAIVMSLLLLPLTGASESRTFFGPDKGWFLPNRVRTLVALALLALLFAGVRFQNYPRVEDGKPEWGQLSAAFSRVFGIG